MWPDPWSVKNGGFDKALAVPGIAGVGLHVDWSEISPALKTYDSASIDRQMAAARSHHLAVQDAFPLDNLPAHPLTLGLARANDIPVAWRTNVWFAQNGKVAGRAGGGCGFHQQMRNAIPCDESSILRLLRNGMFPMGRAGPSKSSLFIEAFPSDVVAFPGAIKAAHDEWKR